MKIIKLKNALKPKTSTFVSFKRNKLYYHLSFDNEFKRSQHLILETYCIFMSFLMSTFHMSSLMLSDSLFVSFFVNLVSVEGFVEFINYHSAVYHWITVFWLKDSYRNGRNTASLPFWKSKTSRDNQNFISKSFEHLKKCINFQH